jgi:hypothetical protein
MGIYLHPTPKDSHNPVIWETLAGVPAGTSAKLARLEAAYPNRDETNSSDETAFYEILFASPDVNRLHSFKLFGWGRINRRFIALAKIYGRNDEADSLPLSGNAQLVSLLLDAQGLNIADILPHISGISWG